MSAPTVAGRPLTYDRYGWGEVIVGTREQLLKLGIGVGERYPGDRGAKKTQANVADPRGLDVDLAPNGDGLFIARIRYKDAPPRPDESGPVEAFCPGVTRQAISCYSDKYEGTAEALVACGLVGPGQFPGLPGMRKTCVTLSPEGEMTTTSEEAQCENRRTGSKQIKRGPAGRYRVFVKISEDEEKRRWDHLIQAERAWSRALESIPRPVSLLVLDLLSRQGGRCEEVVPTAATNVVSLSAWREARKVARE